MVVMEKGGQAESLSGRGREEHSGEVGTTGDERQEEKGWMK